MKPAQDPKNLARQIARQMAQEPLEVLKDVREQVAGPEPPKSNEVPGGQSIREQPKDIIEQKKREDKIKSERLYSAFQRELSDRNHQDLYSKLQTKIAEGHDVSLQEYPELTPEQKDVLKAEMEAVKNQKLKIQSQSQNTLTVPVSKPGRQFGPTRKQEAQKQQTHIEKPMPVSN